jgi:hypothetical protein
MLEVLLWVLVFSLPLKVVSKLLQKIKNREFPD